jgi:hypothetical protein
MLTAISQAVSRLGIAVVLTSAALAADPVVIKASRNTPQEMQTAHLLRQLLASYDLDRYTFTRKVIIDEHAADHAFPALTLDTRFAKSSDDLLSSFLHEQFHWFLQAHPIETEDAVNLLRRFYPRVPVGETEGARTLRSTYTDLLVCYLELQADRRLIGDARTVALVHSKNRFTWIYKTDLDDDKTMSEIIKTTGLEIQ